jgi:hypothetical protein
MPVVSHAVNMTVLWPGPQVGAFERDPERISEIVKEWTGRGKTEFEEMSARAKKLGHPHALNNIVQDLAALSEHPSTLVQGKGRGNWWQASPSLSTSTF